MRATSQATTASPWKEKFTTETTVYLSAAGILSTLLLVALFVALNVKPTKQRLEPFCCPNEARLLNLAVNRSLDPCYSFYNYVCLNTIKERLWPSWDAKISYMESIVTGANLKNNSAAAFLSSIFKSCVATIWRTRPFTAELADTIADMANLKSVMSVSDIFSYLVVTNLKYHFASVLYIEISIGKQYGVKVRLRTLNKTSPLYENYQMAITVAAITFNSKFGTNISLNKVYNFETFIQKKIEESSQNVDPQVERKPPQWMNLEFWKDTFRRGGMISLTAITKLDIEEPIAVETMINAIGKREYHQAALIYLLAHSTVFALRYFTKEIPGDTPQKPVFDRCFQTVDGFLNVKDYMYTVSLTSTEMERHMSELYTLIVRATELDIQSKSSFDKKDISHLLDRLHNFSLVVPSVRLLNITIPTPNLIFSRGYCEGRDYEIRANQLRLKGPYIFHIDLSKPLATFRNKYIIPSPAFFRFYSFNEAHSVFLNMASIGVKISAFLWYGILGSTTGPKETQMKINKFYECFKSRYYAGRTMGFDEVYGIVRALALSTVLRVLNRTEWNSVKTAWSQWKMSSGQLFYLWEGFHLCPFGTGEFDETNFNIPLSYSEDFLSSFKCPNSSRMSRAGACPL